jgi:hypothetical protein
MHIKTLVVLTALAVVLAGDEAWAQGTKPAAQTIHFSSIGELTPPEGASVSLVHGTQVANFSDWPASFYSTHPGGYCTSTLVGPRALLTAAHCAATGTSVAIEMSGKQYKGTCTQSTLYSAGSPDKDWSLCLMESDTPAVTYETINTDSSLIKLNTELLLTGFGCVKTDGTGGNDGQYRIGPSAITGLPTATIDDIVTSGPASICFGDSGGGAFLFLDAAQSKRVQVSVNSRVGVGPDHKLLSTSYLASLSAPDALVFVKKWASENNVAVCGVTAGASHCR